MNFMLSSSSNSNLKPFRSDQHSFLTSLRESLVRKPSDGRAAYTDISPKFTSTSSCASEYTYFSSRKWHSHHMFFQFDPTATDISNVPAAT